MATKFTVKDAAPLLDFLLIKLHGKSRTGVKAMLTRGMVRVDGTVVTQAKHSLVPGQVVAIGDAAPEKPVALRGVKIVFEDDSVIVIDKAAGLLSVATDTGHERSAHSIVSEHVKRKNPRAKVLVVHRLDRDTSGLMMFVKDRELQRQLRQNWQESIETRRYIVLVEGNVAKDSGTITSWLKGTDSLRTYSSKMPNDGQKAISHFTVLKRSTGYTLLSVELETGRKNQIRVHMQDIGHPVVGDEKYGSARLSTDGAQSDPIGRLGLHAAELAFEHPRTGKMLVFRSEPPKEFLQIFS
ncbi:MAG: RluA family pseudouridine synthase [Spirochaetota bacterium]